MVTGTEDKQGNSRKPNRRDLHSSSLSMSTTANPLPRKLSEADLEGLIENLRQQEATRLILVGPWLSIPDSTEEWRVVREEAPAIIYQLNAASPNLAEKISTLTCLTYLDIRCNSIGDSGVESLKSLTNLTHLNLAGNAISAAGAASLKDLRKLTSLNLENNWIGDSGAEYLSSLDSLTWLNLSHTWIGNTGATSLSTLASLDSLILDNNDIGDAGVSALSSLSNLSRLSLRGNRFGDSCLVCLTTLDKLTLLDLAYTVINDVSPLASIASLLKLSLKRTEVQDISPLAPFLKKGLQVNINDSQEDQPCGIDVYGCPIIHPPLEIVIQGKEAILNYFQEIESQGIDYLYEAKALILGEGGAGKTSLLRRLYIRKLGLPEEHDSTKGIDIVSHVLTIDNGKHFRLNVWDFGGQQIYHPTHQFFLTKRSLYILVDDTRNDSVSINDKSFKYWLEVVEALSDSCPLLVFQNEKAGRSKQIDKAGIRARFQNVLGFYSGDLRHSDAARELEAAICFYIQRLDHVGDAVPAQWLSIRSELDKLKSIYPCISLDQYYKLYRKFLPADDGKALKLSQYYHDIGVFLHYQDHPILRRFIILENEWATEAVFKILDDELTKAKGGYFSEADCDRIWADSAYARMHPELIALMERFELCYRLPDKTTGTWLTPQLLPPSTPERFQDWRSPEDLVLTYEYKFLPKGLINRVMVRNHNLVLQPSLSWASGVYFERESSQLLARIMPGGDEIELRSRGISKKELMSVISYNLDALNDQFDGLHGKVRKLVPCNCISCLQSDKPTRFTEEELLARKETGKLTIECRNHPYIAVSVLQLFDGLNLDTFPVVDSLLTPVSGSDSDLPECILAAPSNVLMKSLPVAAVTNNYNIHAGAGSLVNTGSLSNAGSIVNLGALSDQARISIEALSDQRSAEGQPTLRELLQELKASIDADTQVPEDTCAEALTEVTELAKAAQDIEKNTGPARRAINVLRGLSAGISETNKAVEESSKFVGAIKRLLPLIAAFFVG